jgi:hypothetical protein
MIIIGKGETEALEILVHNSVFWLYLYFKSQPQSYAKECLPAL